MIQARIRKRFPARPDAAAFSLEVEFQAAAGVTVLFGPSGSGKTLTLDSIAGFVAPDEGRIMLDDERLEAAEPAADTARLGENSRHCGGRRHGTPPAALARLPPERRRNHAAAGCSGPSGASETIAIRIAPNTA